MQVSADKGSCLAGYGYCGPLPEASSELFMRTMPLYGNYSSAAPSGSDSSTRTATWLFEAMRDQRLDYKQAAAFCSVRTALGLTWQLVDLHTMLSLRSGRTISRDAYLLLHAGERAAFVWSIDVVVTYGTRVPYYMYGFVLCVYSNCTLCMVHGAACIYSHCCCPAGPSLH